MSDNKLPNQITEKEIQESIDQENKKDPVTPESYAVKDFSPNPVTHHNWRQNGVYLECVSCEHPHGTHIGSTDRLFAGTDEKGNPIFVKPRMQNSPSKQAAN